MLGEAVATLIEVLLRGSADGDASALSGLVAGLPLPAWRVHTGLLRVAAFGVCKIGWGEGPLGHGGDDKDCWMKGNPRRLGGAMIFGSQQLK